MNDQWRQPHIYREIQAAREAARLRRAAAREAAAGEGQEFTLGDQNEAVHVAISLATAATHVLVQGVSGRRIAVYELLLWNVAEQDLELLNGSATLTGSLGSFPEKFGMLLPNVGEPHFKLDTGNSLRLTLSAATQVSGFLLYRMEE